LRAFLFRLPLSLFLFLFIISRLPSPFFYFPAPFKSEFYFFNIIYFFIFESPQKLFFLFEGRKKVENGNNNKILSSLYACERNGRAHKLGWREDSDHNL